MTFAGLAGFLATTAFVTSPANAQTVTLQTDCSTYKPNVLGASGLCEIEKNKLAHQQLNRAQATNLQARDELTCTTLILKDLESGGVKTAKLTAVPPKGEACRTARDLKLISG